MSERGGICRKVGRRGRDRTGDLDVELVDDRVLVRFRGRVIRTLTGPDADAVREAMDDPEELQRAVASRTGKRNRGSER